MSESAWHQKYYFDRTKSIGVRGSTVFVEPESSPATEVLFSSSEMLGDARSTQIVLLLTTKRLLFFRSTKQVLLAFCRLQNVLLRRSDGASPRRSNSISVDETSTSSARAIHQTRLALHTQWFRRSEASSREHAEAECTIITERNASRRSNHYIRSV